MPGRAPQGEDLEPKELVHLAAVDALESEAEDHAADDAEGRIPRHPSGLLLGAPLLQGEHGPVLVLRGEALGDGSVHEAHNELLAHHVGGGARVDQDLVPPAEDGGKGTVVVPCRRLSHASPGLRRQVTKAPHRSAEVRRHAVLQLSIAGSRRGSAVPERAVDMRGGHVATNPLQDKTTIGTGRSCTCRGRSSTAGLRRRLGRSSGGSRRRRRRRQRAHRHSADIRDSTTRLRPLLSMDSTRLGSALPALFERHDGLRERGNHLRRVREGALVAAVTPAS